MSFDIGQRLYKGPDDFYEKNLVMERKDNVFLEKGESKQINFSIGKQPFSSYRFVATAENPDGRKSIIKVSIINPATDGVFSFLGIDKFPLKKGEETRVFWCYANFAPYRFTTKQTIEINDSSGNLIEKFEFDDLETSGTRRGAETTFVSPTDSKKFAITGKIFDTAGNLQNTVQLVYDDKKFGLVEERKFDSVILLLIIFIIIIIALVVIRRWKS